MMTGAISCFSYLSHGLVQKIIGSHKRAVATAAMRVDKSQKENENAENRILDSWLRSVNSTSVLCYPKFEQDKRKREEGKKAMLA